MEIDRVVRNIGGIWDIVDYINSDSDPSTPIEFVDQDARPSYMETESVSSDVASLLQPQDKTPPRDQSLPSIHTFFENISDLPMISMNDDIDEISNLLPITVNSEISNEPVDNAQFYGQPPSHTSRSNFSTVDTSGLCFTSSCLNTDTHSQSSDNYNSSYSYPSCVELPSSSSLVVPPIESLNATLIQPPDMMSISEVDSTHPDNLTAEEVQQILSGLLKTKHPHLSEDEIRLMVSCFNYSGWRLNGRVKSDFPQAMQQELFAIFEDYRCNFGSDTVPCPPSKTTNEELEKKMHPAMSTEEVTEMDSDDERDRIVSRLILSSKARRHTPIHTSTNSRNCSGKVIKQRTIKGMKAKLYDKNRTSPQSDWGYYTENTFANHNRYSRKDVAESSYIESDNFNHSVVFKTPRGNVHNIYGNFRRGCGNVPMKKNSTKNTSFNNMPRLMILTENETATDSAYASCVDTNVDAKHSSSPVAGEKRPESLTKRSPPYNSPSPVAPIVSPTRLPKATKSSPKIKKSSGIRSPAASDSDYSDISECSPPTVSPKIKKKAQGAPPKDNYMWQAVIRLIVDEEHNPINIRWEDRAIGKFVVLLPQGLANYWGNIRGNPTTYDSMSRSLRLYNKAGKMVPTGETRKFRFTNKLPWRKYYDEYKSKVRCDINRSGNGSKQTIRPT